MQKLRSQNERTIFGNFWQNRQRNEKTRKKVPSKIFRPRNINGKNWQNCRRNKISNAPYVVKIGKIAKD